MQMDDISANEKKKKQVAISLLQTELFPLQNYSSEHFVQTNSNSP